MDFKLFYVYFNLPWEHNLERTSTNVARVLKGTPMEVTGQKVAALAMKYGWKEQAIMMDDRVSTQLRKNIEKASVISVSKYMKATEKIIDRFLHMVENLDEDEPIITSIADFEKLVKLQIFLANTAENGRADGGVDEDRVSHFTREELSNVEQVRARIEESSRSRAAVEALVEGDDAVDVFFEED